VWTGLRLGELIGLRWGDVDLTGQPAEVPVQRHSYRVLHIVLGHETLETTMKYYVKLERLRGLLRTSDGTVLVIRRELEELYRMAHQRYEAMPGH
jgi:site-specific recombinase XerC